MARASVPQGPQSLRDLARSFVAKLSPIYDAKKSNNKNKNLSFVPDGTTLLLKPKVDRTIYNGDIYSIKHNGDVFLSLLDTINVLELAIDFDEETKQGSGWFLKEDWRISIDLNANTVISRGAEYRVYDKDIHEEDGNIFIRGDVFADWMGLYFDYDIAQQYLDIQSAHPLPAIAKNMRRERKTQLLQQSNEPKLPRLEVEPEIIDLDIVDVNLRARYNKGPNRDATTQTTSNIALQGQLLQHDAYTFASRDSDRGIRTVRTRFSKQSEDPELLGPLQARYYEFGDVGSYNIPLTGNDSQSLGFNVNNNPLVNANFNTTNIEGNSIPGWDVELYRNGIIIGSQIVDDDARYKFSDATLFAGDNDFELIFYGPQGEIRKETLSIPVTQELLNTQQDTYELSVQLEEENTYQDTTSVDEDRGEVHVAARYNKLLGDNLAYMGLRSRSLSGKRKTFISSGVTTVKGETFYDANVAVDDQLNVAAQIGARRKVGEWDLALNSVVNSDEYTPIETSDPTTLSTSLTARRKFNPIIGNNGNIFGTTTYQESASGRTSLISDLGVSTQIGRLGISNVLRHETRDGPDELIEDKLDNDFSVRGFAGPLYYRAGVGYELAPENQIDRYFTQLNYRYDSKKSADLYLERRPETEYSRARLNLNYLNNYFRTSPYVEVTSDDDVRAGVNLNFNLIDAPGTVLPEITSVKALGRGLVTGFVYHDKNGNYIFDGDDVPLPDVNVESVNIRKKAATNSEGYATLKAMPVSRPTDIVIDEFTLPDSFMISGYPGASVFPVAGQTHKLDFPVHLAGEVDGTLYLQEKDGDKKPYANKLLQLIPIDDPEKEIIETQTMFDGFFLFSKVPPGHYIMMPNKKSIKDSIGNAMPRLIHIGYDGTTVLGQEMLLKSGYGFVPYTVDYDGISAKNTKMLQPDYILEINRSGKSELANLLNEITFRTFAPPALRGLTKLQQKEDEKIDLYSGSQEQLHEACAQLSRRNIACTIRMTLSKSEDV